MAVAHDVFAELNPAFCAYSISAFSRSYKESFGSGPHLSLCYIAVPIALSGDLAEAFVGTNRSTGLLEWLGRAPQTHVGMAERLNASMSLVAEAVRYGCFSGMISLNDEGVVEATSLRLNARQVSMLSDESARVFKHAERLGYWFAMAGSTRTVFDMMEISV